MTAVVPGASRLALGAVTFRDRPFDDILAAASAAGWDGIGLTVGECVSALERGIPLESIAQRVADAGLRIAEFELIRLGETGPTVALNAMVQDLVGLLRPDRVHVAAWSGGDEEILDGFAAACAALPGVPVAFEFMAYNRVPGFTKAVRLAEATGQDNAAVVLDVLHFFRTGAGFDELTPEALRRVAVVQLSDVVERPRGDALDEARHRRTYPGLGDLDSVGFLRAIAAAGPMPPISVEPINDGFERLPIAHVADEALRATSRLLTTAGIAIPHST